MQVSLFSTYRQMSNLCGDRSVKVWIQGCSTSHGRAKSSVADMTTGRHSHSFSRNDLVIQGDESLAIISPHSRLPFPKWHLGGEREGKRKDKCCSTLSFSTNLLSIYPRRMGRHSECNQFLLAYEHRSAPFNAEERSELRRGQSSKLCVLEPFDVLKRFETIVMDGDRGENMPCLLTCHGNQTLERRRMNIRSVDISRVLTGSMIIMALIRCFAGLIEATR